MESLVSTDWLAGHLGEAELVVVDSSWHMPASGRSGRDEFVEGRVDSLDAAHYLIEDLTGVKVITLADNEGLVLNLTRLAK